MELIIADVALEAGVFRHQLPCPLWLENMYGSIVLVAIITTVAMPVLLRRVLH